ncbi:hypothetical protein GGE68_005142 [Rhizobium leguminosarum]|nr:hypothetical protein [Rhizobium leguminosarum]
MAAPSALPGISPQVGRLAGRAGFPKQLTSQHDETLDGREGLATCDLPTYGGSEGRARPVARPGPGRAEGAGTVQSLHSCVFVIVKPTTFPNPANLIAKTAG